MVPAEPVVFWQYFDILSVGILTILVGLFVLHETRRTKKLPQTISSAVAEHPSTSISFAIVMTIFFPLYYAFLWFWVGPYVTAPYLFYVLAIVSFICELIFVWLPARGKYHVIHTSTATLVGVCMFAVSVLLLSTSVDLGPIGVWSIIGFWVTTIVAFLLARNGRTLIAEITYCAGFLAMVSVIAHF